MNKWKMTGITLAVLVTAGVVFVNSPLMMAAVFYFMQPNESFADSVPPAAPNYTNPNHWASLPSKEDAADIVPVGYSSQAGEKENIAVFFVHPTTYLESAGWNQPLDHAATNKRTDDTVMRNQASVFNGCCDVYAPRYRQATIFSFMDDSGAKNGEQALALAYDDVAAAFQEFLRLNPDRPIVLAGHSQGSHHLDRLIEEEVVGTALANRLVAAYPIGFSVDNSNGLPVCESIAQVGCQVTWNASAADAPVQLAEPGDICVNPLSWSTNEQPASYDANLGGVDFMAGGEIEPGVVDAQCKDSQLIVSDIRSVNYIGRPFGEGNYHIYDYSFFYMNIRANVQTRVDAFLATHALTTAMN